ncbi:hypothetical protein SERLADRAFT_414937 [Serpula lacrymans var. lacrymans S7.9]|uniref:AB hydrolase-1 domain-containing protein n=1 Tax=Serpula lacrymans var. lacrymans (strain S7.9) TaxID=578457 RepID=F8NUX9_SERL9|nr:uncharacterized protein SERLADRAFT_414937 [Serpula lacrymans var. lacrymans S7.9]EGO25294.1 hypothetical protein SERLADRAFT_414937 [Serpula lacrymans var. lacrymans S7.9]
MSVQAPEIQYYHHGRFKVAGGVLPDAITAYQTYGDPKNPCIVFPACYGAKLTLGFQNHLVGEGKVRSQIQYGPNVTSNLVNKALDPRNYFIVTFALFCNGESSSPSNTPSPYNGPYFPHTSYEDNIRAQYSVLTKGLGVDKAFCALGFSMGGQQAYHWAVMYPEFVERIIAICSSARTSPHNRCVLEGPKAAMLASKDYDGGHYTSPPQHGLRAFGRVMCAWMYGQTWFRQQRYTLNGNYSDLESFMKGEGEANWLQNWDANDMMALLDTWQNGDISQVRDGGDYKKALRSISAKVLLLPARTDLCFPPEDSQIEASYLQDVKLRIIDTDWGHNAGGGANITDVEFVSANIREFLN